MQKKTMQKKNSVELNTHEMCKQVINMNLKILRQLMCL